MGRFLDKEARHTGTQGLQRQIEFPKCLTISKKPNDHENDNNRDAKGPENGPPKSAVNRVSFWSTFTNGVVSRLAQTKNQSNNSI